MLFLLPLLTLQLVLTEGFNFHRETRDVDYNGNHPPSEAEKLLTVALAQVKEENTREEKKIDSSNLYDLVLREKLNVSKVVAEGEEDDINVKPFVVKKQNKVESSSILSNDDKIEVTTSVATSTTPRRRVVQRRKRPQVTTEKPVKGVYEGQNAPQPDVFVSQHKSPVRKVVRQRKRPERVTTEVPVVENNKLEDEVIISRTPKKPNDKIRVKGYYSVKSEDEVATPKTIERRPIVTTERVVTGATFKKRTRERDPVVKIVNMESYVFADQGNFHYSFEGADGTNQFQKGYLVKEAVNEDGEKSVGESVEGGFSYKDKDGKDYSLSYTAGVNGYRPVGAHLPTPPPIPPAIARALEYLATKPTESATEGF